MPIETNFRKLDNMPIEDVEEWLLRDTVPKISWETVRYLFRRWASAMRKTHTGGRVAGAAWYIAHGRKFPAQLADDVEKYLNEHEDQLTAKDLAKFRRLVETARKEPHRPSGGSGPRPGTSGGPRPGAAWYINRNRRFPDNLADDAEKYLHGHWGELTEKQTGQIRRWIEDAKAAPTRDLAVRRSRGRPRKQIA